MHLDHLTELPSNQAYPFSLTPRHTCVKHVTIRLLRHIDNDHLYIFGQVFIKYLSKCPFLFVANLSVINN